MSASPMSSHQAGDHGVDSGDADRHVRHLADDVTRDIADRVAAHVDPARLLDSIQTLASFGARADGGVDRPALSPVDLDARAWLVERASALGCEVHVDACANLFFRRPGAHDVPPVVTGSHADTQPTGGKLDGCYGVLAGMEVLATLAALDIRTHYPVDVVVWTNEEGTRFQPGAMGSSAYVEPSRLAQYLPVTDADCVPLADAIDAHTRALPGLTARSLAAPMRAFVELHIEQGPLLEMAGAPLGIVDGIQGVRWYDIRCEGMAAHAGTTPMAARRDAMTLACAVRAELEAIALSLGGEHTRVTFGRWSVTPNAINTIASQVTFSVDFRHPDPTVLARFDDALAQCVVRHGVSARALFQHAPVAFHPDVLGHVEQACASVCGPVPRLTSGAFHDAMYLAQHCPTAMLFVPSRGGISHNPAEATDDAHLVLGARALAHCITTLSHPF
ncbi:Zn-dependent hydrolase [Pandoraea capi]|uniref:Zn-dependent hydrolase n=1 Tax=Pandoraea capi TaxID=2508286 RepID=A0ABY6W701_9BURK|nr:M20 family metallo-hydrolase [Pandoraea capi]VVE26555.1 Zn-dependent hydrolase [Pandoraea capi]